MVIKERIERLEKVGCIRDTIVLVLHWSSMVSLNVKSFISATQ